MARKSRLGSDIVKAVSRLPWWLGVTLAPISYVIFHEIAVEQPSSLGSLQSILLAQFKYTFSMIAQYVAPVLFALGAVASFGRRRVRKKLFTSLKSNDALSVLNKMSWQEFELLVGEYFRSKGYTVSENGGGGADGGIDLNVKKGGKLFVVQCKHWQSSNVPVSVVRETFGVMAAKSAAGAFVVTSGDFTKQAKNFAKENKALSVINGHELATMIYGGDIASRVTNKKACSKNPHNITCPRCASPMVQRQAKRGHNIGKSFLGCSRYPACTAVINK